MEAQGWAKFSDKTFKLFGGYAVQLIQVGIHRSNHFYLIPVIPTVSLNDHSVQHCNYKKSPDH